LIGRIAFWLLLPALVLTVGAIGTVIDVAGDAPGQSMFGGIVLFLDAIVLFVVLASMTSQALLIARRPQSLSERTLPTRIAVLQLALYGVIGLWVVLLVSIDIFVASWLFVAAIITLSVLLLTRIQRWPLAPSAALPAVRLPVWMRVALSAYSVLAIGAIAYVIAALVDPTLDADGLRPLILLAAFGLPLSLVALPVALLGSLIDVGSPLFALPLLAIALNVVVAQLLLWAPRVRVRLVNWFFRLGKGEEPATTVTGSSL
jgi:hypothetical protein